MIQIPVMQNQIPERFQISGRTDKITSLFPEGKSARNVMNGVYFIIGLQGETIVEIDGKTYTIRKGTFICLTPNHLLLMLFRSDDFLFEYLSFEFDFLSDFPLLLKADISEKMGAMPFLQLDSPTYSLVTNYYDFIVSRYNGGANQIEIIKGLLFSFVIEISRIYSGESVDVKLSRKKELTDGFFRLLHKYYKEERTAAFYAGQLCITDKYLSRVIRQVTGNTFYFWVSNFIMKEIKILLKSTEMSITEIADELKFPNSSFFARFFHKYTGMSPMQYRKNVC